MDLLGRIQHEIYSGHERKEDESRIYFDGGSDKIDNILEEKYKGYEYNIETTGACPMVSINQKAIPMSCFSGKNGVTLKNRKGDDLIFTRASVSQTFSTLYFHVYKYHGDYIYPDKEGHHYTLNELTADAKAAIDDLIRQETEYAEKLRNDPDLMKQLTGKDKHL